MAEYQPVRYTDLAAAGILAERAAAALARLKACDLCPRKCFADRTNGLKAVACRTGVNAVVSSHGPHHGEEDCLRGTHGSGTIFFAHCNLRCDFCQNYDISYNGEGEPVPPADLAEIMLSLQRMGCHNINFVSPSHVVAQILAAVAIAAERGLRIPLVYNTGGYDSADALALLDGVIDIYMPDMKFACSELGHTYAHVRNYAEANRLAVKEMHRQVGDLVLDRHGLAVRGLMIRHLVLPDGLAGTASVAAFLAREVSPHTYVNVMGQYRPCHKVGDDPHLGRRPTSEEYGEAVAACRRAGLTRFDGRWMI